VSSAPDNRDGVRSVQRALYLLTLFDEDHPSRTMRELVEMAELPKTTVLRLIQTLEQSGYLYDRPDGRICLGPKLIRLSRAVDLVWRLPVAVDATMERLRERSRETVNLYVREGQFRVCAAQKQGPQTIRYVVPVGMQLPLWGGAAAKVLLANAAPELIDHVLKDGGKDATYREWLLHELKRVREAGFAASHGERERGSSSVAAPIRAGELTVAALAISGPTMRFTDTRVHEFAELLRNATQDMERSFTKDMDRDGLGTAWVGTSAAH
jgi:DNA-binding IclR family transcriptional regulator